MRSRVEIVNRNKTETSGAIITEREGGEFQALIKSVYGRRISPKEAIDLGSNFILALELLSKNENCIISKK